MFSPCTQKSTALAAALSSPSGVMDKELAELNQSPSSAPASPLISLPSSPLTPTAHAVSEPGPGVFNSQSQTYLSPNTFEACQRAYNQLGLTPEFGEAPTSVTTHPSLSTPSSLSKDQYTTPSSLYKVEKMEPPDCDCSTGTPSPAPGIILDLSSPAECSVAHSETLPSHTCSYFQEKTVESQHSVSSILDESMVHDAQHMSDFSQLGLYTQHSPLLPNSQIERSSPGNWLDNEPESPKLSLNNDPSPTQKEPDNASWPEPPQLLPAQLPRNDRMEVDEGVLRSQELSNLGSDFTQLGLYTQQPDTCIKPAPPVKVEVFRPKPPVKIEVVRPVACPVNKLKESQSQLSKGPSKLNISAKSSFSRPDQIKARPATSDFSQLADYSSQHSAGYTSPANYMYNPHGYPAEITSSHGYPADIPAGTSHGYPTDQPSSQFSQMSSSQASQDFSFTQFQDMLNEQENTSGIYSSQLSCTQMSSSQMSSMQMSSTQMSSTQMSSTQMSSTQMSSTPVPITEKSASSSPKPDSNTAKLIQQDKAARSIRSKRFKDKIIKAVLKREATLIKTKKALSACKSRMTRCQKPDIDRLTLATTKKYVKDRITEAVKDLANVKKLNMRDDTDKTARADTLNPLHLSELVAGLDDERQLLIKVFTQQKEAVLQLKQLCSMGTQASEGFAKQPVLATSSSGSSQQPTNKQPTNKQPTNKQPTTKQPTTKQPTNKQPTNKQPTNKQPTNKQPALVNSNKQSVSHKRKGMSWNSTVQLLNGHQPSVKTTNQPAATVVKKSIFPPKKDDKLEKTKSLLESTKVLSISMKHKMSSSQSISSSQSATAKRKLNDKPEIKREAIVTSKDLPQKIQPKPTQLELVKSQTIDTSTSPMLFPDSTQDSTIPPSSPIMQVKITSPIMQVKITSPKLQPRNSPPPGTRTSPRLRALAANSQSNRASPRPGPYNKSPLSLSPQVIRRSRQKAAEPSLPPSSYHQNLVSLPKHVADSLKDNIASLPHLTNQRPTLPKAKSPPKLQPSPLSWGTLPQTQPDTQQPSQSPQSDPKNREDSNHLVAQFFAQQRAKFSSLSQSPPIIDDEEMSPPSFGSNEGVYHSSDAVFTESNEQYSQPTLDTQYSQSIHTLIASPVVKQVKIRNVCGGKAIKDAAHRALVELEHIHISPHAKPKQSSQESMEVGGDQLNLIPARSQGSSVGGDAIRCGDGARAVQPTTYQQQEQGAAFFDIEALLSSNYHIRIVRDNEIIPDSISGITRDFWSDKCSIIPQQLLDDLDF